MSYIIKVYLKNASFSEEYALEKHEGNDSPENIRYEWEDDFKLGGDIENVEVTRDKTYPLSGEKGENESFTFDIENCMIFLFQSNEGITPIVFSEKCVDEYELDNEKKRLTVYLNDIEVVENPIPGIYIVLSQFPTTLRG